MLQVDSDAVSLFVAELKETQSSKQLLRDHQGVMGQNNQLPSSSECVRMCMCA